MGVVSWVQETGPRKDWQLCGASCRGPSGPGRGWGHGRSHGLSGRGRPRARQRAARWGRRPATGSAGESRRERGPRGRVRLRQRRLTVRAAVRMCRCFRWRRRTASCVRTQLQRSFVSSARKTFVKRSPAPSLCRLAALAFISCPCAAPCPRSSFVSSTLTPYSYAVLRCAPLFWKAPGARSSAAGDERPGQP